MFIASIWVVFVMMLYTIYLHICAKCKNEDCYKTFEKVILEHPKFNKHYNVYCSDQVEARYMLSPVFMERFYNLEKTFNAKNIKCSFFEDKLIIAIETKKDLYELGSLFKSVKDSSNVYRFYKEVKSILDIIDVLKL